MIKAILLSLAGGIVGLWLVVNLVPGVEFSGSMQRLLIAGLVLGIIIAVAKPLVGFLSFLLRWITITLILFLALFILARLLPELEIQGIVPLLWSVFTIGVVSLILSFFLK